MDLKKEIYHSSVREDLIAFIPKTTKHILEVGCGVGATGKAIKDDARFNAEVIGVEAVDDVAKKAQAVLDKVIIGNIEQVTLPFDPRYFDCIIFGDVLEHLIDPWAVLKKCAELLNQNGLIIASIPNIAHYRIIKMLKKQEWNYQDRGIMDKTHLRFFTLKSIEDMFLKAGLNINKVMRKIAGSSTKKFFNKVLGGRLEDQLTEQYIILAQKN